MSSSNYNNFKHFQYMESQKDKLEKWKNMIQDPGVIQDIQYSKEEDLQIGSGDR